MTLSDFASFSTAVSGLAVTASLVYLAMQTHQAAKHTKALITQNRATRTMEFLMKAGESDFVTASIKANGGTPTAENVAQLQFISICNTAFISWDDTFGQHEDGLVNHYQFGSFVGSITRPLSLLSWQKAWAEWKALHPNSNPEFIQFIDEIVARTPLTSAETLISGD